MAKDSICLNLELADKSPIYVEKATFKRKANQVILTFRKFSMGYEGGSYNKTKELKLDIFDSYVYQSKYELNKIENNLKMGYKFLDVCENKALVQFFTKKLENNIEEIYSDYYLIGE